MPVHTTLHLQSVKVIFSAPVGRYANYACVLPKQLFFLRNRVYIYAYQVIIPIYAADFNMVAATAM